MEKTKRTYGNQWKIFCIILCFAAVSVLGASCVSIAAEAPNGSYKKTCTSIYYNESADRITSASCKKMDGSWNKSAQYFNCSQCGGDISNCNGTLECTGVNLPNVGSYQKSCWCCRMTGTQLGCYCNPKKGKSIFTTLNNATGYADIWNDNGSLKGK